MRDGACKTKYINLAVIRSLESLLIGIIEGACGTEIPGILDKDSKGEIKNLVERIINQNEQTHGLFYLEPDGDFKLAVPSVAMLRVSIALRAKEHYEVIRDARVGRLQPPFRNKLGWLTGNLYSRVDTHEWPEEIGADKARQKVDQIIQDIDDATSSLWLSKKRVDYSISKDESIKLMPKDQARDAINRHTPPKPSDAVIDRVAELAPQVLGLIQLPDIKAGAEILKTDHGYLRLLIDRIGRTLHELLPLPRRWELGERIGADERMRAMAIAPIDRFAMEFVRRRGDKNDQSLRSDFAARRIFDPEWLGLIMAHVEAMGLDEPTRAPIAVTLQDLTPDEPMIDYLSVLVRAGAANGLVGRLAKRLKGDNVIAALFNTED